MEGCDLPNMATGTRLRTDELRLYSRQHAYYVAKAAPATWVKYGALWSFVGSRTQGQTRQTLLKGIQFLISQKPLHAPFFNVIVYHGQLRGSVFVPVSFYYFLHNGME